MPADTLRGALPLPRIAFGVAAVVSLVILFVPASGVPTAPPGTDKVVHVLLFAVLALTGRWAGFAPGPLGVALTLYAVVSEVVQGTPALNRSTSFVDGLADVAGVGVGLLVWAVLSRRAR